jgi:hypothetical protein
LIISDTIVIIKRQKEANMKKIIKSVIAIFFLILSILLIVSINKVGIVPNNYMIIGSIILLVLNLIADTLLFVKGIISKIFCVILYIILLIITIGGMYISHTANNFLDTAFNNVQKEFELKYYVMSPNEYKEEELNNKDIYYFNNVTYVNDAITKLNEKFVTNMIPSDDIDEIITKDLFLIDEATLHLLIDDKGFELDKYHIIYTIDLKYTIEHETITNNEDKHYFNIYVGGYDFSGYHMDMNKIITVNTDTNEVLITNIHRGSGRPPARPETDEGR